MVNTQRLFDTFHELLQINSPSLEEEPVAKYILKRFNKLSLEAFVDDSARVTSSNTGNVICRLDGKIKGQPVLFNAHMDTIQPTTKLRIIEEEDVIKSSGDTILGADNKAGLAVIIEMVEVIKEKGLTHLPIEIVFTVSEEIGLKGANALDFQALKPRTGYCFDGGGPAGHLIMQAPTQEVIEVEFKGKAVHAGIEPEKGISAVYAAAKAAAAFPQGRLDEETTANLGTIEGGEATNIVADKAKFNAEVRSHNETKLKTTIAKIEEAVKKAADETKSKVNIKRHTSFVGFRLEKEEPVVKIATQAMKEIGLEPTFAVSGGGSDANVFNLKGIRTLTLSMGAQMAHSPEEFIVKEELVKTAELAVKIVEVASGVTY